MTHNNGSRYIRLVHRLVAEAFIPNLDNKPTVDHINRDKTDNRVSNLRWATHSEQNFNRRHRDPISSHKYIRILDTATPYKVQINHLKIQKQFKTLEEAIAFRDSQAVSEVRGESSRVWNL